MVKRRKTTKQSHHLWQSNATNDGDVMINRTKAEREDLDDLELYQARSAASLGLWGASMTDLGQFSRLPHNASKHYSKVARELQESGETAPKVMSWKNLNTAFGADKVCSVKESIEFGMKARLASKELNIPFVMAADLVEDWEKVGTAVLKDVIDSVKKKAQSLNLFEDPAYQKSDFQEETENYEQADNLTDEEKSLLEDFMYEAFFDKDDNTFSLTLVVGDNYPLEAEEASFVIDQAVRVAPGFSQFTATDYGYASVLENKDQYSDAMDLYYELSNLYGSKLDWNVDDEDKGYLLKWLGSPVNASKYPKALVKKVQEVLSSPVPKIAIDQAAAEYYKAYYGPFGESLVKEVKKRVKADLSKLWMVKQGVDEAAAEYWSAYYADTGYGADMTKDVKDRKKAQSMDLFSDPSYQKPQDAEIKENVLSRNPDLGAEDYDMSLEEQELAKEYNVGITYDIVTPESAEEGDFAESGWELEPEDMSAEDIIRYMQDLGVYENNGDGSWYTAGSVQDYSTGEEISYAVHVKNVDGSPLTADQIKFFDDQAN